MAKCLCQSWLLMFLFLSPLWPAMARADEPLVGAFLFSTPGCEPCRRVEDILSAPPSACEPPQQPEGVASGAESDCLSCGIVHPEHALWTQSSSTDRLDVRIFDPAQPQDYSVLLDLQRRHGVRIRQMPTLFVGDAVLEGEEAICQQLPDLVEDCVSRGGCAFPSRAQPYRKRELISIIPPPQLLQRVSSPVPGVVGYTGTEAECPSCLFGANAVSAAYFYRGTRWPEEQWSWFLVRFWLEHRQNLSVRSFDVDHADNEALWQDLCQYYSRSSDCATPTVFVGAYALLEEEIELPRLIAAWKGYSRELMPSPWQLLEEGQPRPRPRPTVATPQGRGDGVAEASSHPESEPVAHAAVFFGTTCPHCKAVEKEVLSRLQAEYGSRLDIQAFNVEEAQDYEVLLNLESRYGVHIADVPVIFIGDVVLEGEEMIREGFYAQIENCLQGGGCKSPTERQPAGEAPAVESTHASALEEELGPGITAYQGTGSEGSGQPAVHIAYFTEQGCPECHRAWYDLRHLLGRYANVYLRVYDIGASESKLLNEALTEHYGAPEQKHLSTPALFIGDRYFLGEEITLQQVEAAYQEYSVRGSPAPWDLVAGQIEGARARIVDRFRSLGLYTVVAAGLIDGLNPCAFATIVLFISYLAISRRKGGEILTVGAAFTLGVFLTYLLVGVGLWRLLESLDFLASVGRWVYLITGLICFILGVLSILDYRKARRGELEEMSLSLPHSLRMRINRVIRQTRRARAYVGAAFVTGLAVSVIELACTGQVYLPTIIFVMGVPELRVRAFLCLLLYNLMLVLPLGGGLHPGLPGHYLQAVDPLPPDTSGHREAGHVSSLLRPLRLAALRGARGMTRDGR